jgi:hypothetical protein
LGRSTDDGRGGLFDEGVRGTCATTAGAVGSKIPGPAGGSMGESEAGLSTTWFERECTLIDSALDQVEAELQRARGLKAIPPSIVQVFDEARTRIDDVRSRLAAGCGEASLADRLAARTAIEQLASKEAELEARRARLEGAAHVLENGRSLHRLKSGRERHHNRRDGATAELRELAAGEEPPDLSRPDLSPVEWVEAAWIADEGTHSRVERAAPKLGEFLATVSRVDWDLGPVGDECSSPAAEVERTVAVLQGVEPTPEPPSAPEEEVESVREKSPEPPTTGVGTSDEGPEPAAEDQELAAEDEGPEPAAEDQELAAEDEGPELAAEDEVAGRAPDRTIASAPGVDRSEDSPGSQAGLQTVHKDALPGMASAEEVAPPEDEPEADPLVQQVTPSARPPKESTTRMATRSQATSRGAVVAARRLGHSEATQWDGPLPSVLATFEAFVKARWIAPDGRVAPASWLEPGFEDRLDAAAANALRRGEVFELCVYCRALEALERTPPVFPDDLETIARAVTSPDPINAGVSEARRGLIEEAWSAEAVRPVRAWRVRLVLEALWPAPSWRVPPDPSLVESAGLDGHWLALCQRAYDAAVRGADLLDIWRSRQSDTTVEPAQVLDEERRNLHETLKRLALHAGGKILRNHCKDAWQEFIDEARPILAALLPLDRGGQEFNPNRVEAAVSKLLLRHEEIAEKKSAKFQDRNHMDRAAGEIAAAAARVISAQKAVLTAAHRKPVAFDDIDTTFVDTLLAEAGSPADLTLGALARRLGKEAAGKDPLEASWRLICRKPGLLPFLSPPTIVVGKRGAARLEDSSGWSLAPACSESATTDPAVAASAVLLDGYKLQGTVSPRTIQARLAEEGRPDLALHLAPGSSVDTASLPVVKLGVDIDPRVEEVRALTVLLDHVAHPASGEVQVVARIAGGLQRDGAAASPAGMGPAELERLADGWLNEVARWASRALEAEIERGSAFSSEVLRELERGRYSDAAERLGLDRPQGDEPAFRETRWRKNPLDEWTSPLDWLTERGDSKSYPGSGIASRWTRLRNKRQGSAALRALMGFLFSDQSIEEDVAELLPAEGKLPPRLRIDVPKLRLMLNDQNPTFIPQLARYSAIVVWTPREPATSPAFSNDSASLVAHKDPAGPVLSFVLAPRLSSAGRSRTQSEFSRRGHAAAVLDDLDLCRLLDAGERSRRPPLALIEIALEQLPIAKVQPFEIKEGSQSGPEMFVGRREEAEALAERKAYSRLFSGRRLGKSALLRAVERRYNGRPLAGGTRLQAIYVPFVGVASEDQAVDAIVREVQLAVGLEIDQGEPEPIARLSAFVTRLVAARPDQSFLLVLDEADLFVEEQIRRYEQDRERSLTFVMRSLLEGTGGGRVRFVVSGYRVTNTRKGAWGNWGEVLKLKPLPDADAEDLVARPLARIGIDAEAHAASIAHRCGKQPAILLKYGQTLLRKLGLAGGSRDGVTVTADAVSAAFHDHDVQSEIRMLVSMNFQGGHPLPRAVFWALVGEFARLPPGASLPDAPQRVVGVLTERSGSSLWERDDRAAVARVRDALRELEGRQLVVQPLGLQHEAEAWALRFPHHLPVLLVDEPARQVREAIADAERTPAQAEANRLGTAIFPEGEIDQIRELLHEPGGGSFAFVLGSAWKEGLLDSKSGFSERAGYQRDAVFHSEDLSGAFLTKSEGPLLLLGADEAVTEQLLSDWNSDKPAPLVVGGPELIRWFHARDAQAEPTVGLLRQGRLPDQAVRFWLERVRGIEFPNRRSLDKLVSAVAGIPYLLGVVDQRLANLAGENATTTRVREVLDHLHAEILPRMLDEHALTDRERQILSAVVSASAGALDGPVDKQAEELRFWLTEMWDDLGAEGAALNAEKGDGVAVEYLCALGLVPSLVGRSVATMLPLPKGDPVRVALSG